MRWSSVSVPTASTHTESSRKNISCPTCSLPTRDTASRKSFGVWKEKTLYGRKYMGIERTTVIIGRDGRIARIFPKVQIPGHVQAVEAAIRELA